MCLLLLAFDAVPGRPWLLLGNRDEFHGRASLPAAPWLDSPDVVGGRDVEAGGSWLAVHRSGRFAAVTNVRSGGNSRRAPRSRGALVADFVRGIAAPLEYAAAIAGERDQYGPFNLIVGDRTSAAGASSTSAHSWSNRPGVHVLSNGAPQADWPKVRRLRERFEALLQAGALSGEATSAEHELLDLLADTGGAADDELPETGVGLELERRLAPIFIVGPQYGTRASTLAYLRDDGSCVLIERSFGPDGVPLGQARIET